MHLHLEVWTYEGFVKAPRLHQLGMYKCVLGIYAVVLRHTLNSTSIQRSDSETLSQTKASLSV